MSENNLSEELLKALQKGDQQSINRIASTLLTTNDKQVNRVEANLFERYANCKIHPQERDIFHFRCFVGVIYYGGNAYYFG